MQSFEDTMTSINPVPSLVTKHFVFGRLKNYIYKLHYGRQIFIVRQGDISRLETLGHVKTDSPGLTQTLQFVTHSDGTLLIRGHWVMALATYKHCIIHLQ